MESVQANSDLVPNAAPSVEPKGSANLFDSLCLRLRGTVTFAEDIVNSDPGLWSDDV